MSYEWDEQKRQINIKKHGIDFLDVEEIFDGDIVTIPDERFDDGENRFIVIGILRSTVVVVVYTERGENIRIISARKATKNEQIYYFQQISN
ncbi:MAG: BrnT family toxin [Anaerolineales bacterium]|nr:BrnT family toxin [Anaerolineales bacterium]MCX7754026.1 BrnT family toxin [Anaerolineales bacterium]MDW8276768.1 BrnT family toxin [Anaerolineales bacterium]